MPSFRARVIRIDIAELLKSGDKLDGTMHFFVTLERPDGSKTGIAEFDPEPESLQLVNRLQLGREYVFPDIFLEWGKKP